MVVDGEGVVLGSKQPWYQRLVVAPDVGGGGFEADVHLEPLRDGVAVRVPPALGLRDNRISADDPTRPHGLAWHVEVTPADPSTVTIDPPTRPSLPAAIAYSLEYLEAALADQVPADFAQPSPVPACVDPVTVDNPEPALCRLGKDRSGEQVVVHFVPSGCHVYLREWDDLRQLAGASDVSGLLAELGLSDP
ncbi:hypothetical protein ACI2K4_13710 [Micromonospora sp. NPDC050397]|uniref:hypothetical protein n=1 Tax=Micromonospora sp. NPDC050397 TaxID=3364279 RepID=UPI003850F296